MRSPLHALLDRATTDVTTPAAQCVVIHDGDTLHTSAHGQVPAGPTTPTTRFDLASTTKLATTCAVAIAVDRGLLDLDAAVGTILPHVAFPDRTVRELLGHRAGLVPWRPWFDVARQDPRCAGLWCDEEGDRTRARTLTLDAALSTAPGPRGARAYSDLGFIALGEIAAIVTGQRLDTLLHDEVLGRDGARFRPVDRCGADPTIAPTGDTRPRRPAPGQDGAYAADPHTSTPLGGEVDDDNAWALGGVSGHAGLFGSATQLAALGESIRADIEGASKLAGPRVWDALIAPDAPEILPARSLGFDRPSPSGSSVGEQFGRGPRGAIGHLGFTGCSLWIDLDRALVVALVTNRTALGRDRSEGIRALRRAVHQAALDLITS